MAFHTCLLPRLNFVNGIRPTTQCLWAKHQAQQQKLFVKSRNNNSQSKSLSTLSTINCLNSSDEKYGHQRRSFFTDCFRRTSQSQTLESEPIPHTTQLNEKSPIDPFKLVQNDMKNLYIEIRNDLESKTELAELKQISTYYFDGQGKAIRPLIIILMARAMNHHVNGNSELISSQKRVALINEMIHTASLFHDDVIDKAETRRGKPSVNAVWGQKKAVFAGDFVIAKSSLMLAQLSDTKLVSILSQCLIDLILGEFMQMGSEKDGEERFAHYIQKTFRKTASLIAYTCKAITYIVTSDETLQEAAFQFGKNLGLAFQLIDDLLDFVSSQAELGKPAANDLKLGLATAPVLFASEKYPELNPLIIRRFSEPGDVEKAFEAVMNSDGISRTRMLAQQHADEAASSIACLSDTPEKQALLELCKIVINRKK